MNHTLPFKENKNINLGVELELQLIDLQNFNLAMEAKDFIRRIAEIPFTGEVKPEITLAMIEINSSVHFNYDSLITELHHIRNILAEEALQAHIGICGGGTHSFQKWQEQRIFPTERFLSVSEQYGYLAQQFTIFGQHIHIGCPNGDDALYLCHAFAYYLPQFIALSAASPFHQGIDTNFDCSRLTVISSFPLSGTPPWVLTWAEFEVYFEQMLNLGIVTSMKDFYWDIRPKAEFGTVEIRICDTPLTVDKAADLAAYAQMLAAWLIDTRPQLTSNIYFAYPYNRFNAARYGLNAIFIDPIQQKKLPLIDIIMQTCEALIPYAKKLNSEESLQRIKTSAAQMQNDATWIRAQHVQFKSLADTVKKQTELWRGKV